MHDTIKDNTSHPAESEINLTLHRLIDAPIETVYAAWTNPSILERWFAPGDAMVARAVADVAVGGRFLVEMRGPDGGRSIVRGRYREVVPHRRLAHTWRWEGSDIESLVTVEFEPTSTGKTRLTLTHSRFAQEGALSRGARGGTPRMEKTRDEHERGWSGCLAKLDDAIARHMAKSA